MKQCTRLTAKEGFSFRASNRGRAVTVKKGQRFWVCNSEINQQQSNSVMVARETGNTGNAYAFTVDQVETLFDSDIA